MPLVPFYKQPERLIQEQASVLFPNILYFVLSKNTIFDYYLFTFARLQLRPLYFGFSIG